MNKQKTLGSVVFVTIALLVMTTGLVFAAGLTQGGPPQFAEPEREDNGEYWGPMHGRRGRGSSEGSIPPMHDVMVQAVADATGLSVDEIEVRIISGERLVQIALDAGINEADYFELMAEAREAFWAEALENGWISEERYQGMLERRDGEQFGPGYGGCHEFDTEGDSTGGRGPGRGRGRRW
jgi:hypothetical protein